MMQAARGAAPTVKRQDHTQQGAHSSVAFDAVGHSATTLALASGMNTTS